MNSEFFKVPATKLRKRPTFRYASTGFLKKWLLRKEPRNCLLMTCHYPDLGSVYDWSCCEGNLVSQSEALPRFGKCHVISVEFLQSLLRRYFAGKPLVMSWNLGYFLTYASLNPSRFLVKWLLKSPMSKCISFPPTSKTPANQEKVFKWFLGRFIWWHHRLSSSFIVLKTIVMVSVHSWLLLDKTLIFFQTAFQVPLKVLISLRRRKA